MLTAALTLALCGSQPLPRPVDVRVGMVAYEDFHGEKERYERLFRELARRDPSFRFRLAVGSYGDVLHWIDSRSVDLAILTPGAFAGMAGKRGATGYQYVASVELPPATSCWAGQERRQAAVHRSYRSVCLVPEASPLRTLDDLRRLVGQRGVEFLMVHPVSISGRIAPQQALREAGIELDASSIRFTYSHSQSIRMLQEPTAERQRVAFVWDDASGADPRMEAGVRRLEFPELERLEIPHDVVVARTDYESLGRLRPLLLTDINDDTWYGFVYSDTWAVDFRTVATWLRQSSGGAYRNDDEVASLDEIGHLLLQHARSQPRPPRLALVLSGGGAKCSYQIGAVAALEEHLAEIRRQNPQHPIDIGLVVGTSGGAINALPVAIGVTNSPAGRLAFRDTWQQLDQRDIVRPSWLIRLNMGIWFALLQTAFVIWLVRRFVRKRSRRARPAAIVFTVLAGMEVAVGYLHFSPWSWLGQHHILHHAWLWLSFGVRASAWSLFFIGIAATVLATIQVRRRRWIRIPEKWTRPLLLVGILGLPLVQLVTVLTVEETLSGGHGMEDALAQKYPRLINAHLEAQHQRPLDTNGSSTSPDILKSVSRQIVARRLCARDLVITGSCLNQTSQELPSDLYFFAAAGPSSPAPQFGERGILLTEHPDILLDVILGSGSIFPVFPARSIGGIPRPGDRIELIDGGFAHNSPIEAAVMWGATHIVSIDVMQRKRGGSGNFLNNVTSSFRHLHRQAQLIDARSRGIVTVFTLSPEPPHLCVLDFADNLITASIDQGYQDASMTEPAGTPRFHREYGEPVFGDVPP